MQSLLFSQIHSPIQQRQFTNCRVSLAERNALQPGLFISGNLLRQLKQLWYVHFFGRQYTLLVHCGELHV